MALRDQPYLPLFIQDFLTDEKLAECSASATGVFIRLMCLMHKSENYGKILLKQKYKQTGKHVSDFAIQVAKQMPYELPVVEAALIELLEERVLRIEGDFLVQKRMVKDGEISDKRAVAGKTGGKKTQDRNKVIAYDFAKANDKANTENEIENETESDDEDIKGGVGEFLPSIIRPGADDLDRELTEVETGGIVEYVRITGQKALTVQQVSDYWGAFKIQYFTGEKVYNGWNAVRQHFRDWIKKQVQNGSKSITGGGGKSAADRRAEASADINDELAEAIAIARAGKGGY